MNDVRLGRDDQRVTRQCLGEGENAARRADIVGMIDDVRRALGMRGNRRAGMLRLELKQLGLREALMDDAHARPEQHVAPQLAIEISAQMLVRPENHFLLGRDLREDDLRRRGGDDDVAERLHLGRAVDVAERNMIRMRLPEGLELAGRATVLKGAARVHVRQDHGLVRREDLRGLRHEAHAAKGDHLRVRLRRLARELERIAHEVRQILNLRLLIIMGEDDRVALLAQSIDLAEQIDPCERAADTAACVHDFESPVPFPRQMACRGGRIKGAKARGSFARPWDGPRRACQQALAR